MYRLLALIAFLAACVSTPISESLEPGWVRWAPPDQSLIAEIRAAIDSIRRESPEADEEPSLDEYLEFDPFAAVPDSRFLNAVPQLPLGSEKLFHCQMGVTGSSVAIVHFSPVPLDERRVTIPYLRCQPDAEKRASFCEYVEEGGYYWGSPNNFVRFHESIDEELLVSVVDALYAGRARLSIPEFDYDDWPNDWYRDLQGAYFARESMSDEPYKRFELNLYGCGCNSSLVFSKGLEADPGNPVIEEIGGYCI